MASGHGRIEAAEKLLGCPTITCRVESVTDAQMKKEVLVEYVNRSELNEEERFLAVEQYAKELGFACENLDSLTLSILNCMHAGPV